MSYPFIAVNSLDEPGDFVGLGYKRKNFMDSGMRFSVRPSQWKQTQGDDLNDLATKPVALSSSSL